MDRARSASHSGLLRFVAIPLVVGALLLGGCGFGTARFQQTSNVSAPHASGGPIKVTSRNGAIAVKRGAVADVAITATLRMTTQERIAQATISANRNAEGVLEITALPPTGGWRSSEGCSFEVLVPEAVPVDLNTGNGAIEIAGLAGVAKLRTSNGAIRVSDHNGELDAKTSNGRIEADGVAGKITARSSNGRIVLRQTAGAPVEANTSNGAVSVELAESFRGVLDIGTSNGSISLPGTAPSGVARFLSESRRGRAKLTVDDGPTSTIRTSNGSVTVRYAGK
jgi:hypothetical protein